MKIESFKIKLFLYDENNRKKLSKMRKYFE